MSHLKQALRQWSMQRLTFCRMQLNNILRVSCWLGKVIPSFIDTCWTFNGKLRLLFVINCLKSNNLWRQCVFSLMVLKDSSPRHPSRLTLSGSRASKSAPLCHLGSSAVWFFTPSGSDAPQCRSLEEPLCTRGRIFHFALEHIISPHRRNAEAQILHRFGEGGPLGIYSGGGLCGVIGHTRCGYSSADAPCSIDYRRFEQWREIKTRLSGWKKNRSELLFFSTTVPWARFCTLGVQ